MDERPADRAVPRWADAWIGIGVGIFVLAMNPRWLQWASSRLFHTHFDEFVDSNGVVVSYTQVPAFWSDLGPVIFGLAILVDGLLSMTRIRALAFAGLSLTVISTLFNAGYLILSFSQYGLAPWSFVAVIFGGYIAMHQWQSLKQSSPILRAEAVDEPM